MIQISYKSQYSPYDRFIHLLNSPETQRTYTKHLNQFLRYCKFGKYEQLLEEISDTEKFELITDFLIYLKKERNVSPSTINITFSAIKRFYKSNRVAALDWDQLAYYKGKFTGKVIEDRLYTNEEIKQLLDCADLREKVLVYILLSTGMRIGGLTELKLRDLTFMENKKIYQFKVYSESIPDRYITFCTPECAEIINKYLKYRENQGDTLKPSSPLIYRKVTRYDKKNKKVIFDNQFDRPMTSQSVQQIFTRLQRRSSIFPKEQVEEQEKQDTYNSKRGRIRKPVMRCHAFRKMFDTICIKNNVNHSVKEKLMGHKKKQELDYNYFRPSDTQLLEEYLKVVDDLTINEESRLSKQIQELRTKNQDKDYVIKGKLQEKDDEIRGMKEQINEMNKKFEKVFSMIQQNPILAQVKSEALKNKRIL